MSRRETPTKAAAKLPVGPFPETAVITPTPARFTRVTGSGTAPNAPRNFPSRLTVRLAGGGGGGERGVHRPLHGLRGQRVEAEDDREDRDHQERQARNHDEDEIRPAREGSPGRSAGHVRGECLPLPRVLDGHVRLLYA